MASETLADAEAKCASTTGCYSRFAPDVGRCEDAQIDLNGDIHLTLMQSLAHSAEDRPIEPKVPALMLILIYAIGLFIKNTNFRCFFPSSKRGALRWQYRIGIVDLVNVRSPDVHVESGLIATVESFRRRQASESLRCPNRMLSILSYGESGFARGPVRLMGAE